MVNTYRTFVSGIDSRFFTKNNCTEVKSEKKEERESQVLRRERGQKGGRS